MALLHVDYFSFVLGMEMQMDVILPETTRGQIGMEGRENGDRWPTLYLLHGMSDDHTIWQRRTSIERYAADKGIAVVMPTTHLGWYTDMYRGLKYFTATALELPKICRQMFPNLSPRREDTWAAGLSMGGSGALKCALRAPEVFSRAASLSGGVDAEAVAGRLNDESRKGYWRDVFGPPESIRGSVNDLFAAASQLKDSPLRPEIYMWCGTEDFLYDQNVRMRDHLRALGYPLRYEESPGDHQWKYWDAKIQTVLDWLVPDDKEA